MRPTHPAPFFHSSPVGSWVTSLGLSLLLGTALGQLQPATGSCAGQRPGLLCSLPVCSRNTGLRAGRRSLRGQEGLCCFFAHPSQRERPFYSLLFIPPLLVKEVNQMSSYYTCEHYSGCQCFACKIVLAIPLHTSWY